MGRRAGLNRFGGDADTACVIARDGERTSAQIVNQPRSGTPTSPPVPLLPFSAPNAVHLLRPVSLQFEICFRARRPARFRGSGARELPLREHCQPLTAAPGGQADLDAGNAQMSRCSTARRNRRKDAHLLLLQALTSAIHPRERASSSCGTAQPAIDCIGREQGGRSVRALAAAKQPARPSRLDTEGPQGWLRACRVGMPDKQPHAALVPSDA